jgi:mono/diheme cytochrome c family protein
VETPSQRNPGRLARVFLIWGLLLGIGVWWVRSKEPPAPVAPANLRGVPGVRLLYQFECGRCHRVDGLPGMDVATLGPPLRIPYTDREYLRQSLHDPGRIVVKGYLNVMPRYDHLTVEQERELLDYLCKKS